MSEEARHALGASPPFREMEVGGVRLTYNDDGEGMTLVCLHAIGHGASDYRSVREGLSEKYRVIALDWPGHGNSDPDGVPASPWRYAELLEIFLDQLGIEHAVLLGNSIGGGVAIRYAAAHMQRVRGLVLCNPQGLDRAGWLAPILCRSMARFFGAGARGAKWFDRAFEFYYKMVLAAPAANAQRARIIAARREMAPILAQAWSSFAQAQADARALAPQIRVPVQLCWAMRDRFIPLSRNRAAALRFPIARLEKFEDSGHSPFIEEPPHFLHVLQRFLDGLRQNRL